MYREKLNQAAEGHASSNYTDKNLPGFTHCKGDFIAGAEWAAKFMLDSKEPLKLTDSELEQLPNPEDNPSRKYRILEVSLYDNKEYYIQRKVKVWWWYEWRYVLDEYGDKRNFITYPWALEHVNKLVFGRKEEVVSYHP